MAKKDILDEELIPEPFDNFEDHHKLFRWIHKTRWRYFEPVETIGPEFYITPNPKKHRKDGLSTD